MQPVYDLVLLDSVIRGGRGHSGIWHGNRGYQRLVAPPDIASHSSQIVIDQNQLSSSE